jgi:hypothetical protein
VAIELDPGGWTGWRCWARKAGAFGSKAGGEEDGQKLFGEREGFLAEELRTW